MVETEKEGEGENDQGRKVSWGTGESLDRGLVVVVDRVDCVAN